MTFQQSTKATLAFIVFFFSTFTWADTPSCPEFLNTEFRKLHSTESINLCKLYSGKPIVIVNTASHCGFTSQFKDLETLYQRYKEKGVEVVGFASNDFKQAADSEEKAAGICYKNYGVTFTMIAPTSVKGKKANSTFQYLAQKSKAPSWNFNKYLVTGTEVKRFDSKTKPLDSDLEDEIKKYVF